MDKEIIKEAYKLPIKHDGWGIYIIDAEDRMIAQVRGWGYLSREFGEAKAKKIQKAVGEAIANALNEHLK